MRFLATFIMKGRMSAMTVASTAALLSLPFPPASIVSSASVALVTLRRGASEGLYVLICACLAAGLLSLVLLGGYQFALLYGLVLWLPVWLIAIVLREGRLLSVAVETAVGLGILAVIAVYLFLSEPAGLWRGVLELLIQPMLAAKPDIPAVNVKEAADKFAHYMTGVIAAGSIYGLLLGLFLARWWQALLYNPGGFRSEFIALAGHRPLAFATLALLGFASVTSGLASELSWNVLLVLFALYTTIGTALLHAVFAAGNWARFMVPLLYITLVAVPHVMALIALCGVVDPWLDLRNKFKSNGA
ncbi:hypothetical protein ACQE3E_12485 [Methylomonas sp. MED-D]|nr:MULTISPECIES: hypothetical protein [unclassified Methylomonas]MDT4331766.1 hypothetical protein [Methylomonas sp. MV1]WGS83834.1 hypothetical protein QC632_12270 [Methylomonas sp. UP202]